MTAFCHKCKREAHVIAVEEHPDLQDGDYCETCLSRQVRRDYTREEMRRAFEAGYKGSVCGPGGANFDTWMNTGRLEARMWRV